MYIFSLPEGMEVEMILLGVFVCFHPPKVTGLQCEGGCNSLHLIPHVKRLWRNVLPHYSSGGVSPEVRFSGQILADLQLPAL